MYECQPVKCKKNAIHMQLQSLLLYTATDTDTTKIDSLIENFTQFIFQFENKRTRHATSCRDTIS